MDHRTVLEMPGFKKPYLWLHVKKTAGTSLRQALGKNYYTPPIPPAFAGKSYIPSFMEVEPIYWNSVLNRYRTPLGEYTFKKSLFASKFLYANYSDIVSFSISREPYERCRSMFRYMYSAPKLSIFKRIIKKIRRKGLFNNEREDFQLFLEYVKYIRTDPWKDIHFSTHSANVWDDITDESGNVIVKHTIRLENIKQGLESVLNEISETPITIDMPYLNKSFSKIHLDNFMTKESEVLVQELYGHDFDIYENAM